MFKSSLACIVNNNITKKEVSVLISYSSSSSQGFQHLRVSCRSVISCHVQNSSFLNQWKTQGLKPFAISYDGKVALIP